MNVVNLALDVVSEAFARKFMIAVAVLISLGLFVLMFALDLDVVDGAIASTRLFGIGGDLKQNVLPVDVALRPIFGFVAWAVFYLGLLFGIVATADIAHKALAPGRVELMLSFPVRRFEFVLGTYLGVLTIAALGTSYAVGGVSLVLFWKADFVTAAPLFGALGALLAFAAIYAAMLFLTTLARSAALAAGGGLMLYVVGLLTSNREWFTGLFSSPMVRQLVGVVIFPLPRLKALADLGNSAASGELLLASPSIKLVVHTLIFATALVAASCYVVQSRDY